MRSFRPVAIALFAWLIAPCTRGQLTLLAYDGFNYPSSASLSGQNGGTGWSGAWVRDYTSGSSLKVSASGLAYSGLSTTGRGITWASGGNGISEASRSLALVNSGVVYLQFLEQFGSSSGGGTPNLRLLSGGTLTGGIGANGGTYGSVISILGSDLNPASNGSSSTSASLSALNLVVLRIDYGSNETRLWINPNLATFDYSNPGTANALYTGLAPAFDTLAFYTRSPASIDELSIYAAIPEPSSVAAIAGAAVLVVAMVRRRKLPGR